tara:strand:- start:320 stop:1321 length:1002 start_codon:yes stop_codon:yes gene_type:complete
MSTSDITRYHREFDYLIRIPHLECINECYRKINIPINIRIIIAQLIGGPTYIERLKNGNDGYVTFRGIPVYSISDSGERYLPSIENRLDKKEWIRRNILDISNLDKVANILDPLELYNDCWIVTRWYKSHLPCYLSNYGRYERPAQLNLLKDHPASEEKKQEISRRYIRKDYSLIPGTEDYALKHMTMNGLKYCIYIHWDLNPSIGYMYNLDLVKGKWCNLGKHNWFIGYAGKYYIILNKKLVNLEINIQKGVLDDILEIAKRKIFGRPHNGEYSDDYFIYGKTLNELIQNIENELKRYSNILNETVGYDFVFSPYYIKSDGTWEDKLRRISK